MMFVLLTILIPGCMFLLLWCSDLRDELKVEKARAKRYEEEARSVKQMNHNLNIANNNFKNRMAAIRRYAHDPKNPTGFTLVEVLVVIGIIAALIGLMLPAVHKVRAASYRAGCISNLRQIGIALSSYEGDHGHYPPGMIKFAPFLNYVPPPPSALYSDPARYSPYWSWQALILPYVEQQAVYDTLNFTLRPWQNPASAYRVPIYSCPADVRSEASYTIEYPIRCTAYLGVNGTDQLRHDGPLTVNLTRRTPDVVDGLSHTIFVGERPPTTNGFYGWWLGGMGDYPYYGSADTLLGAAEYDPTTGTVSHYQPGSITDGPFSEHRRHFWSCHEGGANFLHGDASVKLYSYTGRWVLIAVSTIGGGEVYE